jgi:hypothetical protein
MKDLISASTIVDQITQKLTDIAVAVAENG